MRIVRDPWLAQANLGLPLAFGTKITASGRDFSYKYTVHTNCTLYSVHYSLSFPLDTALTGIQRSQLLIDETVSGKNNEYYRVDHSVS